MKKYEKLIELNHNEIPAIIDLETGEITPLVPKKNNIPSGKEVFEPKGVFQKSYTKSWLFLKSKLTAFEFSVAFELALMAKANTNSLEPLNDDTTVNQLVERFNISRNKVKPLFKKLFDLGVISYIPNNINSKYKNYYIFNPYITHKEGFVFNKEVVTLFKDTYFTNLFNYKLETQSLNDVCENDNLYIIAQELPNNTVYKLGYSSNIKTRLKQYLYHNPAIQILKTFRKDNAKQFEKEFHSTNKSIYLNEWYLYEQVEMLLN